MSSLYLLYLTVLHPHSDPHTPASRIFHEAMLLWQSPVFHVTFHVVRSISAQDKDSDRQLLSEDHSLQ